MFYIPANTAIGDQWYLAYPIVIEAAVSADGVVLRYADIDEEAFGANLVTAYADLLTSIRDRFASLSRHPGQLADQERRSLEVLKTLLQARPLLSSTAS